MLDQEQYDADCDTVEQDWRARFADSKHDALSTTPGYLADDLAPTMWANTEVSETAARAEGKKYTEVYFKDAQFVYSRVQHHVHAKTQKGYVPLGPCMRKGTKKPKCGFPKTRQCSARSIVICRGKLPMRADTTSGSLANATASAASWDAEAANG